MTAGGPAERAGTHRGLGTARSYLFVPAHRLDRVTKARDSGADEVIVDLEDAVGPDDKDAARQALSQLPAGRPVCVRVNAPGTSHHEADIDAVAAMPSLAAVMVPKVEDPGDVAVVAGALGPGVPVMALVETALGLTRVAVIATAGVTRLILGSADYLADLGVPPSADVLAYPRSVLAVASRAAGLPPPVDGPMLQVDDEAALGADARAARALGMGAKLCIHPRQVPVVNEVFGATVAEVAWARGVLEAAGNHEGVFVFDGAMVDEPVLARARRILERHRPSTAKERP